MSGASIKHAVDMARRNESLFMDVGEWTGQLAESHCYNKYWLSGSSVGQRFSIRILRLPAGRNVILGSMPGGELPR